MYSFTQAIELTIEAALEQDPSFKVFALGADYKNGVDGTHGDLPERFPGRLVDTPASESTITGMGFGRSLSGLTTLVHHGRAEFALFAADQIFTQAAKWNYQFGGNQPAPFTVRIALGRQWGNGPQHTASFMQLLSSVPGLEVYLASSPVMAHKLLKKAISSSSPSLFLEPRWLYKTQQEIEPKDEAQEAIEGAAEVLHGGDVAILTYGEGVVEALKASDLFPNDSFYLIDFHSLHIGLPEGIIAKIRSIGRCVIFDSYCTSGGPLVEVALGLAQRGVQIDIIRPPHVPVPTATSLSSSYYPNHQDLARCLAAALGAPLAFSELAFEELHLPPTLRLSKTWKIDRS